MPPKKKQRASSVLEGSTPTPLASTPADTTNASTNHAADLKMQDLVLEPELWTDEEEISLFKGMIRWKPVGMHKHFRMISLYQHMRHHGHTSEHTRPQGIQQKLDGLYNMKVLDERENAIDDVDIEPGNERYCEFSLPTLEFYDLMMEKRIDADRASSPGWLDETGDEEAIGSTIEDSDESLSSPASSVRGTRGGRRGRGVRGTRGGRGGRGAKESTPRGKVKAESEDSAESEEEDADEDEEGDDDGDDDEEDEDEAEEDTPTVRAGRGRGRGRGSRGARGRGRAGRKRG